MKICLKLLLLICSIFTSCTIYQLDESSNIVKVTRTETPINVDGILSESVWLKTPSYSLRNNLTGESIPDSTFSTYTKICYDDKNLYIAFICQDKDIYSTFTEHDQHLWEDEVVEVFIDVDDKITTYVEIEVAPTNIYFDSYIVDTLNIDMEETTKFELAGFKSSVKADGTINQREDEDREWVVEMAIPFSSIAKDYNPKKLISTKWKINFYRIDNDADGPVFYAYFPTYGRFHRPSVFGVLQFCQ